MFGQRTNLSRILKNYTKWSAQGFYEVGSFLSARNLHFSLFFLESERTIQKRNTNLFLSNIFDCWKVVGQLKYKALKCILFVFSKKQVVGWKGRIILYIYQIFHSCQPQTLTLLGWRTLIFSFIFITFASYSQ